MRLRGIVIAACVLIGFGNGTRGRATSAPGTQDRGVESGTRALDALAADFWAWRARRQPISSDDIPRLDRAAGWVPDWSPAAVQASREALAGFDRRWKAIAPTGWPIARQVDYRLIGSALARVRWELDVARGWKRNPRFYVQQTLGAVLDALLPPPPFDAIRSSDVLRRLDSIPTTVEHAEANLTDAVGPFARLAIADLENVRPRFEQTARELTPLLAADAVLRLDAAVDRAASALEGFRGWLSARLAAMPVQTAVGRDAYLFFLRNAALLSYTPEEILAMGRQEWERAVAFEAIEKERNRGLPDLPIAATLDAQIARQAIDERAVRGFLERRDLLSVPAGLPRYINAAVPPYVEPFADLGVPDDLTSLERRGQHARHYIPAPSPSLGYFALSMARDPRPIIVHEGVPGHYLQLVRSWANEDAIRRHYYDAGANEGIAFYAEEMLLQAGLFDDSPRTREIIYNFMRLRALRVEADVRLALGSFTVDQAAEYLHKTVPMDASTAREEAASFAAEPGQAISYQVSKLQIVKLLADARREKGDAFTLRAFHDFLWRNGNVPIALLRWEYLGTPDMLLPLTATAADGRRP